MKLLIQLNKATPLFVIAFLLVCFGLMPLAQAVVPAPDGYYPPGNSNTAEGFNALFSSPTGPYNTAVGLNALYSDTTGSRNTAVGVNALRFNTVGNASSGNSNTSIGVNTLYVNSGSQNTAIGDSALFSNAGAANNTAVGYQALFRNTSGNLNTANGPFALINNITGDSNTALGVFAGYGITTASNVICINASGANVNNSCYINNIWNQPGGSQAVYVNSQGKLGFQVSSRRFKGEIKPIEQASEVIYTLKPVSFRYKAEIEPTRPLSFGLIAEEVEKVSPDLVMCDADGKPGSVRYDAVNAMLLNEFLKEHRKVEEQQTTIGQVKDNAAKQEATISELKRDMDLLTAQLKEQDSKIQKVSAEIQMNKIAAQTTLSDR